MKGTARLILPWMYDEQRDAIFNDARWAICEAGTKSGKTLGCICWLLAHAWQNGADGREFWWLAPSYPQTKIAYRRLKRMLRKMQGQADEQFIRKIGARHRRDVKGMSLRLARHHESEVWVELFNGARIVFKTAEDPDNLFGEDVWAAVMDEATRCREPSWHAVRTTLTYTRGPARLIGNVKGRKNWMWRLARRAEAGEVDMHYQRITCHDAARAGVLDPQEIEDAKRTMPEHVYRELYLAEAATDEGNPFGVDAIRDCIQGDDETWRADGPVVAWGWDLAKYVNWTVGIGLNSSGQVVKFLRFRKDWEATENVIAIEVGTDSALVDASGVGDPVNERLMNRCPMLEGQKFTDQSKQGLYVGLGSAIHRRAIGYPAGIIPAELEALEYIVRTSVDGRVTGVSYHAPSNMTEDCVAALSLAVRRLESGPKPPTLSVIETEEERQPMEDSNWLEAPEIWS